MLRRGSQGHTEFRRSTLRQRRADHRRHHRQSGHYRAQTRRNGAVGDAARTRAPKSRRAGGESDEGLLHRDALSRVANAGERSAWLDGDSEAGVS